MEGHSKKDLGCVLEMCQAFSNGASDPGHSQAQAVAPRPGAGPGGRQESRPGNEDSLVLTAAELTAVAGS